MPDTYELSISSHRTGRPSLREVHHLRQDDGGGLVAGEGGGIGAARR